MCVIMPLRVSVLQGVCTDVVFWGYSVSHAIFTCSCSHYLTFVWLQDIFITSIFHLPSSVFWPSTPSYDLPNTLWFSVFCLPISIHLLPYSIFHLMFLCSISIIIYPPSVHYSLPSLSNLDNSTFHSLWLCESSFTFSVLHRSLYYSESCSIKFFLNCTYFPSL